MNRLVSSEYLAKGGNLLHHGNTCCVQFVHGSLWRNTDRADEQGRLAVDDNVKEFVELTIGVVILQRRDKWARLVRSRE